MDTPETLLFFGTFNPPTLGHAYVIEEALRLFPSSNLWIIPADRPIWDKKGVVSFEHRKEMLELLIHDKRVQIIDIEHSQQLSGRTKETLDILLAQNPDKRFRIVMGADSFRTFEQWYEWQKIVELAPISVIPRADVQVSSLSDRVTLHSVSDKAEKWFSSTQVKEDLQLLGHTVQVSESVYHYIEDHNLYEKM